MPRGFQEGKIPKLSDNGPGWWYGCQPYAPAAFTPRKYSWYSFLLETESTPGPQCDLKDYVNEKFQSHHLESNQRPSDL